MKTQELMAEVFSLPIDERVRMVDSLLKSLNTPVLSVESQWTHLARARLQDVRTGKTVTVPGESVFHAVWQRYGK